HGVRRQDGDEPLAVLDRNADLGRGADDLHARRPAAGSGCVGHHAFAICAARGGALRGMGPMGPQGCPGCVGPMGPWAGRGGRRCPPVGPTLPTHGPIGPTLRSLTPLSSRSSLSRKELPMFGRFRIALLTAACASLLTWATPTAQAPAGA